MKYQPMVSYTVSEMNAAADQAGRVAVGRFKAEVWERERAKWGANVTHVRRDGDCEGYCAACNLRDFAELLAHAEVTG